MMIYTKEGWKDLDMTVRVSAHNGGKITFDGEGLRVSSSSPAIPQDQEEAEEKAIKVGSWTLSKNRAIRKWLLSTSKWGGDHPDYVEYSSKYNLERVPFPLTRPEHEKENIVVIEGNRVIVKSKVKKRVEKPAFRKNYSDSDILAIRAKHAAGGAVSSLARMYNSTAGTISAIVDRRTYKHVE